MNDEDIKKSLKATIEEERLTNHDEFQIKGILPTVINRKMHIRVYYEIQVKLIPA